MLAAWATIYGEARANMCAKRLPPRPITGRWGTASAAEAALLICGEVKLPNIFFHALIDGRRGRRSASETVDVDGTDEDYSERLSRWLREAYAELINSSF